jgi:hypothetical protein
VFGAHDSNAKYVSSALPITSVVAPGWFGKSVQAIEATTDMGEILEQAETRAGVLGTYSHSTSAVK